MTLTPQQLALYANQVTRRCLEECDGDVASALTAAEYILATQPVDAALATEGQGHWITKDGGQHIYIKDGRMHFQGKAVEVVKAAPVPTQQHEMVSVTDSGIKEAGDDSPFSIIQSLPDFKPVSVTQVPTGHIRSYGDIDELSVKGIDSYKGGSKNPIAVIKYNSQLYVVDGHHRLAAAIKRGDKAINAKVVETRDGRKFRDAATGAALSLDTTYIDAFFAHDIQNRKVQGILNRSLKAAKNLSAGAKKELEAALKLGAGASGEAILAFITKYRTKLADLLTTTQLASVLEGAREVAKDIPTLATFHGAVPLPPTLEPTEAVELVERLEILKGDERAVEVYKLPTQQQTYIQQAIAAREAGGPIVPPVFTPQHDDLPDEEKIHFPIIDEAVKHLSEKNVLTRDKYDELNAAARAKSFTVARVDSDQTLTKIRDVLAENVKQGADYETFRKEIMGAVDAGTFMSDAHMETVFRTNVQSAFSDGQMTVLSNPLVRSGFPYVARHSIHDDRVRPHHEDLDNLGIQGTNVYRVDDPVWQMFRAPWDYNCRCNDTFLTVRQASEAGIEEAQKWLDTGEEPAEKAFVSMPDFSPPPGFQRLVSSAPLSIQLSLQSIASFGFDTNEKRVAAVLSISDNDYPRDNSNRFIDKFAIAEAARDPAKATELRESLPEEHRYKLDRAMGLLNGGGTLHHPKESPGLAINADGIIKSPQWDEYSRKHTAREEWEARDTERADWRADVEAFTKAVRDDGPATSAYRSISSAVDAESVGDTREAIEDAIKGHCEHLDEVEALLDSIGATDAEMRASARARTAAESEVVATIEKYIHHKKSEDKELVSDAFNVLLDTFQAAVAKVVTVYEGVVECVHRRIDECEGIDVEPDEPEEPSDAALSNEDNTNERFNLIAEILVKLFGDGAEDVAKSLGNQGISAALAIGNPKVKRRYGKKPGPGWTTGGTSSKGQQIWVWGAAPGGSTAPTPTPQPAAHQPAPTPVHTPPVPPPAPTPQAPPTPVPTPTAVTPPLRAGGQKARAASIQAYNDAMTKLNAGQPLTQAEKLSLSKKLSNMPTNMLMALEKKLMPIGPPPANRKIAVDNVKYLLTGRLQGTPPPQAPPTPPTPPVPTTAATTPSTFRDVTDVLVDVGANKAVDPARIAAAQVAVASMSDFQLNVLMRGSALNLTGAHLRSEKIADLQAFMQKHTGTFGGFDYKDGIRVTSKPVASTAPLGHSTIPFKDETSWETGKPQQGVVLNGIPFEPAPPKFWEKVKDVKTFKEPPTSSRHTRAGLLIQEPDGRVWICQPTNGFGGRNHTLPGGTVEPGLTDQQNALKETWEETGLQCEITGYVGDFEDDNWNRGKPVGQGQKVGRLYLAKRIGGAPWDAKEEAHIPPSRKNGTKAESESVMLVTPEKAAQLLHHKDDLAQLAAVCPIDYKLGPGSERLARLMHGLKPAAKQFEADSGGSHKAGDCLLHVVQELRGFNAKPTVVPKSDMDALIKKGDHIEMLRGINDFGSLTGKQMAEQFRTEDHYPGYGMFGNGTYADSSKGHKNVATSGRYGSGSTAGVLRMALPKTAKIIKQSELEKILGPQRYGKKAPDGYFTAHGSPSDYYKGVHAALAGYDAIHVDKGGPGSSKYGQDYYVVLNRGVLVVQKEDAKGHVVK